MKLNARYGNVLQLPGINDNNMLMHGNDGKETRICRGKFKGLKKPVIKFLHSRSRSFSVELLINYYGINSNHNYSNYSEYGVKNVGNIKDFLQRNFQFINVLPSSSITIFFITF